MPRKTTRLDSGGEECEHLTEAKKNRDEVGKCGSRRRRGARAPVLAMAIAIAMASLRATTTPIKSGETRVARRERGVTYYRCKMVDGPNIAQC